VLITKDQWRQMQYVSGNAPIDSGFSVPDDFEEDEELSV